MSDLKLFRITDGVATELPSASLKLEKSLQTVVEQNMLTIFGVRFLASEYSTGVKHGGRIDSLGVDENSSPVIFEYKRTINDNVINQGLFYLDWLLDHRAEFKLLVMERLGPDAGDAIDWRNPRLICVANGFTRYDEHAVQQINRSIELVRYRDFSGDLLALELMTSSKVESNNASDAPAPKGGVNSKTVTEFLEQSSQALKDLYFELEQYCESLGDDVTKKVLKHYFAFRRLKNFACVEVHPQTKALLVYLKLGLTAMELKDGFSRDVSKIGHFGTGDLELKIRTQTDLEAALPLIQRSYEAS